MEEEDDSCFCGGGGLGNGVAVSSVEWSLFWLPVGSFLLWVSFFVSSSSVRVESIKG